MFYICFVNYVHIYLGADDSDEEFFDALEDEDGQVRHMYLLHVCC